MTTANFPFDTTLIMSGPFRSPKQMLEDQSYGGHESIHDDAMAEKLGFKGAPIEGPTHFSQFEPLLASLWGKKFYEHGCISAHYLNMVIEGEEVKASVELPAKPLTDINLVKIYAEKKDGTPVLSGTGSIGPDHPQTELDNRVSKLTSPEKLVILRDIKKGDKGAATEHAVMDFDQHLGSFYPFTLAEKLEKITEVCTWHRKDNGNNSPWGRAVIPFEMISVLTQYTSEQAKWKIRSPYVGLFADLEVRLIDGPLFVGERYVLDREVLAVSETKRTESLWTITRVYNEKSGKLVASSVLNHAIVKDSFPGYNEERGK